MNLSLEIKILSLLIAQNAGDESKVSEMYRHLLEARIVFIEQQITEKLANSVVAQLQFLETKDPDTDIYLYINSPGGLVDAGIAIYDTMQQIKPDIVTISIGLSASIAALLLAAGTPGKRLALPDTCIMISQPMGKVSKTIDIRMLAQKILYRVALLNELLAAHTGQSFEKIKKDTEQEYFMSAQEALDYGIVDRIIEEISER